MHEIYFLLPQAKILFSEVQKLLFPCFLRERAVHTWVFPPNVWTYFFHAVGNFFEEGIPWKLPTLKLLPPVYDYSDLQYEETEVRRNYWDCHCLLSNFSKVLFDVYIKSKDDNPHHIFCSLLYKQAFSHPLFKHFWHWKETKLKGAANTLAHISTYMHSTNIFFYLKN